MEIKSENHIETTDTIYGNPIITKRGSKNSATCRVHLDITLTDILVWDADRKGAVLVTDPDLILEAISKSGYNPHPVKKSDWEVNEIIMDCDALEKKHKNFNLFMVGYFFGVQKLNGKVVLSIFIEDKRLNGMEELIHESIDILNKKGFTLHLRHRLNVWKTRRYDIGISAIR